MKRDDFGMRIDEVRALATKYSKPELARMVQMGLVPPQQALMAGMMIDRITKSAMQPPTTTVAEDVLAPQQPTSAQSGIMAAPGAPAPSGGVAALPSGLQNMAGGGIVAFADGGEADIPGYAGDRGSVVDAGIIDKIDPNWRSARNRKKYTADDKFAILAEQLQELQSALGYAAGEDKQRIENNIAQVQKEMRSLKPAPSQAADIGGLGALIPSAQAATPMSAKVSAATPAPVVEEEEAVYDPMTGLKITGPQPKPYNPQIKPGTIYEPNPIRDILQGGPGKPKTEPVTPPVPAAEPPKSEFKVTEVAPAPAPDVAKEEPITRPTAPETKLLDVPAEPKFSDEYGKVQDAYKAAGINVDLYKEFRDEIKNKKLSFGEKRDRALGMALMNFGLGLAGARQGQVAQTLSQQGIKALAGYADSMDKIADNEEKLDALDRQIRLADNQFRMTGADSAMRKMEKLQDQRTNIMAKNMEMANRAAEHQYTVGASLYQTDKQFQANMQAAAARIAVALGANRGGFTDQQLVKLRTDMELQHGPALREQNKDKGSKQQIEKIVADEIDNKVLEEVNKARGIRASGKIPVPSGGVGWNVSGGID